MIKFWELRTSIQAILETLHPAILVQGLYHARVFFHVAPQDAIYPYVVFDLPNSIDSGTLENFVLDVDVWDDNLDTTELETLVATIDDELHKKIVLVDDKVGFTIYRDNRMTLADEDPRIKRRKYVYQVRSYQKYYKQ